MRVETRYRREGETYLIEIKLSDLRQMFNSLDPAPFIDKDLDDDAEAYIVDSVREFHLKTPLKLVFYLPAPAAGESTQSLPDAVHNYFAYRADLARKEVNYTLRQGRGSLLIGLAFLFLCISLRQLVALTGYGTVEQILDEGLLISGWVAMWRPMQIFLYDWWPIYLRRRVLEKIQHMPMEVRLLAHAQRDARLGDQLHETTK
jgi:hypothetical protein